MFVIIPTCEHVKIAVLYSFDSYKPIITITPKHPQQ